MDAITLKALAKSPDRASHQLRPPRRQPRADREFHSQGDIATITAAGPRRCDTHPVALPSHQIPSQRPGAQI